MTRAKSRVSENSLFRVCRIALSNVNQFDPILVLRDERSVLIGERASRRRQADFTIGEPYLFFQREYKLSRSGRRSISRLQG